MLYAGRGSSRLGLEPSIWGNPHKIGRGGSRGQAVEMFSRDFGGRADLVEALPQLEGRLITCHCKLEEQCHEDKLIAAFEDLRADHIAAASGKPPED